MTDPTLRERAFEFAKTIADELERSDQSYMSFRRDGYGVDVEMSRVARDMIERYVLRAIEADRKARACPAAE